MHDTKSILRAILSGYALPIDGAHGVAHWARVLENGLRIADATGAARELLRCADLRATTGFEPVGVLESWGIARLNA